MADITDAALLLRRIPYSETSLICHILTASHGRITLMARGARRPKSIFRATLAPLFHLKLSWRPGRQGMGTLTDAQRGEQLVSDDKMLPALEVIAVTDKLFQEGDPHGYDELLEAFMLLNARQADEGQCAALWLMLERAGWLGDLSHCWHCGEDVQQSAPMYWQAAHLLCRCCGKGLEVSPGLRKGMAGVIRQANIYMPQHDRQRWRMMIALVLREHGIKLPDGSQNQQ
ncbi:MAG: DNA repair protein RecO [Mariprofundus sp.]|nr:DNA repair protein RecO [Mariprofundus sp.]